MQRPLAAKSFIDKNEQMISQQNRLRESSQACQNNMIVIVSIVLKVLKLNYLEWQWNSHKIE